MQTSYKTIPFRALMPGQTALSSVAKRNLRLSPFLEARGLGIGDSPFIELKGSWGLPINSFIIKEHEN